MYIAECMIKYNYETVNTLEEIISKETAFDINEKLQ